VSDRGEARPLGALDVAAVVVGAIVGVGIFFTPASVARALPSPAWVVGIWVAGAVIASAGALVFADLSSRFPTAGGVYVFLREGFGPRVGPPTAFLYAWMSLLVVQPGSTAVIAVVLVDHLGILVGPFGEPARTLAAAFVIALFTVTNLVGLRAGGRIQVGMSVFKLVALAALVGVGIAFGRAGVAALPRAVPPEGSPRTWIVLGLVPVLFSFGGAYHGTFIGGAVKNPAKGIPRGILLGVGLVLIGYLGVNVALLGLLGHDHLAASKSPAADAIGRALGPLAEKALAAIIVVSAAGILNTICLGFPFVVYAMAKDGLFFERAGRLSATTGRPVFAVLVQGAVACFALFVGSSRVDVLLTGIAFADAAFQAAVAVVLLRFAAAPLPKGGFRAPIIAPVVFALSELGIGIGCLVDAPKQSALGAAALVLGVGAYAAWRRAG
jgi:APA family basic amino acid/polyamine antiporter